MPAPAGKSSRGRSRLSGSPLGRPGEPSVFASPSTTLVHAETMISAADIAPMGSMRVTGLPPTCHGVVIDENIALNRAHAGAIVAGLLEHLVGAGTGRKVFAR
ncbi:Uncharacterised protein [Mycobacteroides abscessus subsp. abscessus]|nr:Uncharacterised protein [Mycobacteroides abscessus subsp. abscessus]